MTVEGMVESPDHRGLLNSRLEECQRGDEDKVGTRNKIHVMLTMASCILADPCHARPLVEDACKQYEN